MPPLESPAYYDQKPVLNTATAKGGAPMSLRDKGTHNPLLLEALQHPKMAHEPAQQQTSLYKLKKKAAPWKLGPEYMHRKMTQRPVHSRSRQGAALHSQRLAGQDISP